MSDEPVAVARPARRQEQSRGLRLRAKIALLGVLPVVAVLGAQTLIRSWRIDGELERRSEAALREEVDKAALEIERANAAAVGVARVMALAQESGMFGDRPRSLAFARTVLERFPELTGAYFGYEPNADGHDATAGGGAAASFRTGSAIATMRRSSASPR